MCLKPAMDYELLTALLPFLAEYERQPGAPRAVNAFAGWLAGRVGPAPRLPAAPDASLPGAPAAQVFSESVAVARLLVFLNRYARGYARRALAGTPLSSIDEYVYLVVLRRLGALSKTALIHESRHEKPTGMEIIRRLLNDGFIAQEDDTSDRRSKQLRLTPSGHALLAQVDSRMQAVADLLPGDLDGAERRVLLGLLQKLEDFHHTLLESTRAEGFDGLMEAAEKRRRKR
jgi:DNA-binding MarR family transcriptional regulator